MPDVAPPRDPIFACAGEMAERCATFDWSTTSLGLPSTWPRSLRTVVAMTLRNAFPMVVTWGDDFVMVYNDGYIAALGDKHPGALGGTLPEQFREIWSDIEAVQTAVLHGAGTHYAEDVPFVLERHGGPEITYYTFSWSHVPPDEPDAGPGGVLTVLSERTAEVVGARRLRLLNDLSGRVEGLTDPTATLSACGEVLAGASDDLVAATFFQPDDAQTLTSPSTSEDGPPAEVVRCWTEHDVVVSTHATPRVALPVRARGQVAAVLLLEPHPLRLLDEDHLRWLDLVGEQVSQVLGSATARSDEQARLAALAQIDAAKSDFLSNVSHEFRTPLTLLLGPLEDALASPDGSISRTQVDVMHRSGNRLLRLVDALMDIARMDVGSRTAGSGSVEPVDLTDLTRDLVLPFEPAAVQAGLMLATRYEETGTVGLDAALWESIVINLLANAVKYTPAGLIDVTLTVEADQAVLRVRDSGVGIPESQHELIFDRFHRVLAPDAQSVEGTGLGLSLVAEAARALGGSVAVASEPTGGSVFTVRIPRAAAPEDRPIVHPPTHGARLMAEDLVSALDRTADRRRPQDSEHAAAAPAGVPTILVVDDNQDMRQRLAEVLAPLGRVITCRDGIEALDALTTSDRPDSSAIDLVVTDVTMPRLDGLGLVERLRSDPRHAAVPVVVLSARAGPEAAASALELGADDYVVKPFTSTDLLARCRSTLALTRMRADHSSATARDAVLAGVSHEMQTPLTVIMTALDLLALPDTDETTRAEAARRAAARIRVLDRLVRQFLDWSRITAGSPIVVLRAPVALPDLVEAVLREHPRATVTGTGLATRPMVTCDIRRTEQILHTLLAHAARSPDNRVEVEVTEQRAADGDLIAYEIAVSDDGPAVDERVLRGLVTPTPMAGTPSTGAIGLAVSRAVARAQGGDLTLGSMNRHGNVFVLRLVAED